MSAILEAPRDVPTVPARVYSVTRREPQVFGEADVESAVRLGSVRPLVLGEREGQGPVPAQIAAVRSRVPAVRVEDPGVPAHDAHLPVRVRHPGPLALVLRVHTPGERNDEPGAPEVHRCIPRVDQFAHHERLDGVVRQVAVRAPVRAPLLGGLAVQPRAVGVVEGCAVGQVLGLTREAPPRHSAKLELCDFQIFASLALGNRRRPRARSLRCRRRVERLEPRGHVLDQRVGLGTVTRLLRVG